MYVLCYIENPAVFAEEEKDSLEIANNLNKKSGNETSWKYYHSLKIEIKKINKTNNRAINNKY